MAVSVLIRCAERITVVRFFFIIWCLVIERLELVPCRRQERGDGRSAVRASATRCLCPHHGGHGVAFLQPGNLVGITLQPGPHVGGHVVRVDVAAFTKAKDRERAIIVAHDDEAAVICNVNHVETANPLSQGQGHRLGTVAGCLTAATCSNIMLLNETTCQFQRLFCGHRTGPCKTAHSPKGKDGCEQQQGDCLRKEVSFFSHFIILIEVCNANMGAKIQRKDGIAKDFLAFRK